MADFIKMIKKTSRLNDEDAARIAAIKVHESKPKSRMYYKINAQRELGGGKKVDPTSNMPARLKVKYKFCCTKKGVDMYICIFFRKLSMISKWEMKLTGRRGMWLLLVIKYYLRDI